jgi:C4-dicarboxylate-specific signal transduction histidine kinase
MEVTQTLINALLLAAFTSFLWFTTRAQFRNLERRLDRHEERTEARFERLEAKIDSVRLELDAKIEALRADMTQLAFRLGQPPQPQTG